MFSSLFISKMAYICLIGILFFTIITFQASTPTSTYYVGAVVEYVPVVIGRSSSAIVNENAKNYMKFIHTAYENEVDIIVFPESSLTTKGRNAPTANHKNLYSSSYIPDPKDNEIPCNNTSSNVISAVKSISCAAKQYSMYVVINLHEKFNCTGEKCPKNGHLLYNTNVVFDRNGAVIARYRKWNLYGELKLNRTEKPEVSYFHSDFNVTFGQYICFDILFKTPSLNLIEDKNITDILYSSHWFSELPYLTSNAVQSGHSFNYDLNFLSSGYNTPATGSGGSGIYAGKDGVIKNIWSEKRINAMIIAKIPKIINGRREYSINSKDVKTIVYSPSEIPTINGSDPVAQMTLKKDDIKPYITQLLEPINGTHNSTLCHNGHCCHFDVQTEYHDYPAKQSMAYYRYRLAVFNGVRSFGTGGTGGIEVCSIISCTSDTIKSCSKRFNIHRKIINPFIFHSIIISGDFKISRNISRFPLNLTFNMNQLNVTDFTFVTNKLNVTHNTIQYSLTKPHEDVMTFAIYGRNVTGDGLPKTLSNNNLQ